DEVTGIEVVRAVDDQVVVLDDVQDVVDVDAHRQRDHVHVRVEGPQAPGARLDLRLADVGRGVQNLALQVREVDDVTVHEPDRPHAGRGQVERRRRPEAAGADEEDLRPEERALPLLADLAQQEVPAVALDLVGRERGVLDHGKTRLGPLLEAAFEVDDRRVAEVPERLGGQHRTEARLAVDDHRRLWIRHRGADPELEKAAANIRCALDVAVPILVGIAYVDQRDRLAGPDPPAQLLRALLWDDLASLSQHILQSFHLLDNTPNPYRVKRESDQPCWLVAAAAILTAKPSPMWEHCNA